MTLAFHADVLRGSSHVPAPRYSNMSSVWNSCAAKCRLLSVAFLMKMLFDVHVKK